MYIKVNPDIVLASQEVNRLIKSLDESGFRKLFLKNSIQFGLFNNSQDGNFDNALVEQGTNAGTIKHSEIFGIDNEGKIIYKAATDNIELVNNNSWYWLKIAHAYSPNESYLVSIDGSGNLSAPDGDLTEILRGNPNNPSRISFPNSILNTQEYDVQEVIDENNAILSGDFIAETELTIAVVGSFTPGISIPTGSKYPFQYDSCTLTAVLEIVSNTPPSLTSGEEFLIARVRRNGSAITIQDKRGINIYRGKGDFDLHEISESTNPLIGVESVRFASNNTPRDKNIVQIAWTFRSSNWTIDSSVNRVTLIAGLGGKFKSTSDFTDGDFDGWRLYAKDGSYHIIKQSSLSATQINLILDSLDVDLFTDTTQQLIVAPNAEEIELVFKGDSADSEGIDLGDEKVSFPINLEFAAIPLVVFESPAYYNVKYAYKNFKSYSEQVPIPSDEISGYLVESSFDDNGVLTGSTRQIYVSDDDLGFIVLQLAANAYSNRVSSIETGDRFGVETIELDNADPIVDFVVATRFKDVIVNNTLVLSVDHYLNLKTDLPSTLKAGNSFLIRFKGTYTIGGFTIAITQDYVNSGDVGTVLYTLTADDITLSTADNLFFRCLFNGTDWTVQKFVSEVGGSGFVTTSRQVIAGSGLAGGGDLSADRTFDVNVDNVGVEVNSDTLRLKDLGVVTAKLAATSITAAKLGSDVAGSGLGGGNGAAIDVNVDNSTIEVNSDTLRVKDLGITAAKLAAQGAWTNITLLNSWAAGARTPQYRVDFFGQVHLRGDLNASSASNDTISSTMPAGDINQVGFVSRVGVGAPEIYDIAFSNAGVLSSSDRNTLQSAGYTVVLDGLNYWTV